MATIYVNWETDGYSLEELGLKNEVDIPNDIDEEDIVEYLSNEYGFLVNSISY
jgi:hypothetical protein